MISSTENPTLTTQMMNNFLEVAHLHELKEGTKLLLNCVDRIDQEDKHRGGVLFASLQSLVRELKQYDIEDLKCKEE